jgi:hypothetical protein
MAVVVASMSMVVVAAAASMSMVVVAMLAMVATSPLC